MLADTVWPRSGADEGNRSRVRVVGPTLGEVVGRAALPAPPSFDPDRRYIYGGVVSHPDGSLRLAWANRLHTVNLSGKVTGSVWLGEAAHHSAPIVLDDGTVSLTLDKRSVTLDASGRVVGTYPSTVQFIDEPGKSPNLTPEGNLITTSSWGYIHILSGWSWEDSPKHYGYDVPVPAVYADGTLAVCGFTRRGFCRVSPGGKVLWETDLKDADLTPTLNAQGYAAVGALNDEKSVFFNAQGEVVGEYEYAAEFADLDGEGWIGYGRDDDGQRCVVAKLSLTGEIEWEAPLDEDPEETYIRAPVVDSSGRSYAATTRTLWCFNADGEEVFGTSLNGEYVIAVAVVAPGLAAVLTEGELFLIA